MPALNAEFLSLFIESANMHRWNDHIRPLDLTELDKQAHKAAIAWVLGKHEESAGNRVDWRKVIEHTLFSFIQRSVLTDLKPQVFYKMTSERAEQVNAFVLSEVERIVPGFDPGLMGRFKDYLSSDLRSLEDDIIRAAHYLATRWEFDLIYESNRSLYGIDRTRREISEQIGQYIHLAGVSEVLAAGGAFDFLDLVGQLRFQQRWARTPRVPKTTVLGHSLMVADSVYLWGLDAGVDDRTAYNDFYTALFHDLPEVLTKDVISPIKTSIDGLADILEEYEHEQVESTIMPLLKQEWRDEFRFMVYDPFSDRDDPRFGRRDGYAIKTCDLLAAYMEALVSRRYGITSQSLTVGERQLREKLMGRSGFDVKGLVEDLDRLEVRSAPSDGLLSPHVRPQDLRDGNGAVLVLVVLQDRDHGPGEREAGPVEGVDELALEVGLRPVLYPGPPGLEVGEIGDGRRLQPGVLPGCVELQVVAFGAREAHVAGAEQQDPVREPQAVDEVLGVLPELLQPGVGVLGKHEVDHLDLVELVDPDDPLGVRVLPDLAPERREVSGVVYGELGLV